MSMPAPAPFPPAPAPAPATAHATASCSCSFSGACGGGGGGVCLGVQVEVMASSIAAEALPAGKWFAGRGVGLRGALVSMTGVQVSPSLRVETQRVRPMPEERPSATRKQRTPSARAAQHCREALPVPASPTPPHPSGVVLSYCCLSRGAAPRSARGWPATRSSSRASAPSSAQCSKVPPAAATCRCL